jgi:hypothetical protein
MKARAGLTAWALVSAAVAQQAAAVDDYRAGRHEAARAAFAAELSALGAAAPAELRADLALAALRVQRTGEAEAACRPLLDHPESAWRARGEFLLGLAAWQRSDRAVAAASLPDAEPMAWDLAVRATASAFAHWCRAAALQPDDLAARRNAERAQRRLVEQQQARDLAVQQRRSKQAPEPPPPADTPGPAEQVQPALVQQPLSAAELQRLRQQLWQLEQTKQRLRQSQQRDAARAGERDW